MNREIKFRAWDSKNKIMSDGLPFTWFITGEDVDMEFPKTDESLPLNDLREYLSDFVFMQYTGLKDKNGKEIYEGDIVRGLNKITTSTVDFENGCFVWDGGPINYDFPDGFEIFETVGWAEVIGNIYEHPELVK